MKKSLNFSSLYFDDMVFVEDNVSANQLKLPSGKIITLNNEQLEGVKKINEWLNNDVTFFTLSGPAGSGKAQPTDSLVYTPKGPMKIGDLKIGDEVFSPSGKIIKVIGIYPQSIQQTYRITFSDKTSTECNEEHLWNVWTTELHKNKRVNKTMMLKEIIASGLTYGNKKLQYNYSIPLTKAVQFPEQILPIYPYVLGVLIGNGYLDGDTISVTNFEIDKLLSKYPNLNTNDIIKLGLNVKNEFKFIPLIYKYSSIEQRWELLKGLMDGCGVVNKNQVIFSTSSQKLRNDVIELVQSLGGTATKNKNGEINIKTFENPFKIERKINEWNFSKKKFPSRHIVSIEKSRICEQVCISVDSKDGLYLTDNYIVTHNTTIIKKILEKNNWGVVVSAPTHKALKVIRYQTKKDAATLHSLLGLRPDVEIESFNPNDPQFNPIAIPRICDYNFVIIDECSMLNSEIYKLIHETIKNHRIKILFVGDEAQLPPVGEIISPTFVDNTIEKYFLNKVERQKDGNPILEVCDALRNSLNLIDGGFSRTTKINHDSEGIIFTLDKKEFRDFCIEKFKSEEFKRDVDFCKGLVWENRTVSKSNKIIRDELFGLDADIIEVGDIITGYRTITTDNQRTIIIQNSGDYRIVEKSNLEENQFGIRGFRVKLREDVGDMNYRFQDVFIIKTNDFDNLHLYAEMHDYFRDMAKTNKKLWPKYYEFRRNNILMCSIDKYKNGQPRPKFDIIAKDIDYGYFLTIHKSQGSTYENCAIIEGDINKNWNLVDRNKLKYVAFSRASKKCIILTTKIDN